MKGKIWFGIGFMFLSFISFFIGSYLIYLIIQMNDVLIVIESNTMLFYYLMVSYFLLSGILFIVLSVVIIFCPDISVLEKNVQKINLRLNELDKNRFQNEKRKNQSNEKIIENKENKKSFVVMKTNKNVCPNCDSKISQDDEFCKNCGIYLKDWNDEN